MTKITKIISHVLQHELPEELGYSQQFYQKRSAHLVEVQTDRGITGWGECFGPGNIALANKTIVERRYRADDNRLRPAGARVYLASGL